MLAWNTGDTALAGVGSRRPGTCWSRNPGDKESSEVVSQETESWESWKSVEGVVAPVEQEQGKAGEVPGGVTGAAQGVLPRLESGGGREVGTGERVVYAYL